MSDTRKVESALRSVFDMVGGVRIHARVSAPSPRGPTLVFVHGLGVSTRYMEPTMARLATSHTVVALDLPGFGRSGTPTHHLRVAEHARVVVDWLDARGVGPAVFVGNSYGCQVIVDCIARAPERAVGLVLNAPTMDPAHRHALIMVARVLADVPREPWRLATIVARDYWRAGPRRILFTLLDALEDRIEEKLPAIAHPVLVVCGARDPVVTARWASECARLVGIERPGAAGGTMQCVGTAAHALPYDDPATFAAIIANFADHAVRRPPPPS